MLIMPVLELSNSRRVSWSNIHRPMIPAKFSKVLARLEASRVVRSCVVAVEVAEVAR